MLSSFSYVTHFVFWYYLIIIKDYYINWYMLIYIIDIFVCTNHPTRAHARTHAQYKKTLTISLHVLVRIRLTHYITFVKFNPS